MASKEQNSDQGDGSITSSKSEEEKAVKARKTKVTEALLSLGINVAKGSDPPVIAVLGSGGGLRAMIGFLGTLSKLSELNLLDVVTYIGGTSGSTWCMSSLYSNKNWSNFSCMKDLESQLCDQIKSETKRDMKEPFHKLREIFLGDTYSLTDLWAYGVIADILNTMHKKKLSSPKDSCENGENPYPIYSAVEKEYLHQQYNPGAWFEFTPHFCGFPAYKTYVKTEHLGSKFKGGNIVEKQPEKDLTYLQGMWGSACGDTIRHYVCGLLHVILKKLMSALEEAIWGSACGNTMYHNLFTLLYDILQQLISFLDEGMWGSACEDTLRHNLCELFHEILQSLVPFLDGEVSLCEACQKVKHILTCDIKVMVEEVSSSCDAWKKVKQIRTCDLEVVNEKSKHFWHEIAKKIDEALESTRGTSDCKAATLDSCDNLKLFYNIVCCIASWEWGTTNNFLYQWKDKIPEEPEISIKEHLHLVDAGLEMNTPYPLVLPPHRKVDLILSFDFSQGGPFETLTQAAEYCQQHTYPFPEIKIEAEDKDVPSKSCYSFEGNQTPCPCVMHFPLFNTETCGDASKVKEMSSEYDTFLHLFYKEAKLKNLLNISKKNVEKNKDHIVEKIKQCAERCN